MKERNCFMCGGAVTEYYEYEGKIYCPYCYRSEWAGVDAYANNGEKNIERHLHCALNLLEKRVTEKIIAYLKRGKK